MEKVKDKMKRQSWNIGNLPNQDHSRGKALLCFVFVVKLKQPVISIKTSCFI